ncbi:MAG: hypothetical protein R2851_22075 [Caldilineaceae bacterium]
MIVAFSTSPADGSRVASASVQVTFGEEPAPEPTEPPAPEPTGTTCAGTDRTTCTRTDRTPAGADRATGT